MNIPSSELQLHYGAMWRLVNLRGGLDNLGLEGVVKEAVVTQYLHKPVSTQPESELQLPSKQKSLHYPSHPFDTDFCAKIATLPNSFCELILHRYISTDLALALADSIEFCDHREER